jgi:methylenetetrahydrofolate dehydrogenase (NADP+) / methenyltetrahydrofolate cyclohydrolase
MMRSIDGRAHATAIMDDLGSMVESLSASGVTPTLAVLVPTDDGATDWYVRNIARNAAKIGVAVRVDRAYGASVAELMARLDALSGDDTVHGIMCLTPLPEGVALADVAAHIDPAKDVDGANPTSLGRLASGLPAYAPATAAAVLEILSREGVALEGASVAVVGRSTVVGKPAALLLLAQHATVTICHSRTKDLAAVCRSADVLVAAVGQPQLITAEHIKPGAIVIDVGTNPTDDGGLVGDVDATSADGVAGALTPVPGGVGPVTTALLLRHVITSAALTG